MVDITITRATTILHRLIEIILGVAILALGAVLFVFGGRSFYQYLVEPQLSPAPRWIEALFFVTLGAWPVHIGLRLETGRQDRHDGLLSPTVLIVFGLGSLALGVFSLVAYSNAGGLFSFGLMSIFCFGLASEKLRSKVRSRS